MDVLGNNAPGRKVGIAMRKPHILATVTIAAMGLVLGGCSDNSDEVVGPEVEAPATEPAEPTDESPAEPGEGSNDDTSEAPADTTEPSAQDSDTPTDDSGQAYDTDIIDNPPEHTWQEALDAALAEFDGQVIKIELELRDSGRLEYEIELISADTEYEVKFDANTLEQLEVDRDDLGSDAAEDQNKIFDPSAMISLDEAAEIARSQQEGAITEWKLEGKDTGRVQYEFEIYPPGSRHDVEITLDASDGTILEVD